MNTEVVYTRRGFVKMAAGTVAAAALVAAGAESIDFSKAFASTSDGRVLGDAVAKAAMEVGTWYSASVNLYVPAKINVLISMDAYLTNLTTPSIFKKPTTPVSNNGLICKNANGSYTVYVDEFNNTFGLLGIATSANDGTAATVVGSISTSWSASTGARIDALKFSIPSGTAGSHSFDAKEYANYMNVGDKDWPVTLQVDFGTVKSVSGVSVPDDSAFDAVIPTV